MAKDKDDDKKGGFQPFWMKKKSKDKGKNKKGKKGLFGKKGKKVEDKDNDGE